MSGYTELKNPTNKYNKNPLISKESSVSDFKIQYIDSDGYKDYHFNHFIVFFRQAELLDPFEILGMLPKNNLNNSQIKINLQIQYLFENFTNIFSPNPSAKCEFAKGKDGEILKFNSNPVAKFTGSINWRPDLHDDYVSLEKLNNTIKPTIQAMTLVHKSEKDIKDLITEKFGPKDNNKHFLSGTRIWSIGNLSNSDVYYFETIGFERYSEQFYYDIEKEQNLKEKIETTWITMLSNYIEQMNFQILPSKSIAYNKRDNIYFNSHSVPEDKLQNLQEIDWIKKQFVRHPEISFDKIKNPEIRRN